MRTELKKIALGGMLLGTWTVCIAGGTAAAGPGQSVKSNLPKEAVETPGSAKSETVKSGKNVVLVRNTTAKATAPAPTAAKVKAPQEKKTIGRCWRRLMNMAREVSHAHRTKR